MKHGERAGSRVREVGSISPWHYLSRLPWMGSGGGGRGVIPSNRSMAWSGHAPKEERTSRATGGARRVGHGSVGGARANVVARAEGNRASAQGWRRGAGWRPHQQTNQQWHTHQQSNEGGQHRMVAVADAGTWEWGGMARSEASSRSDSTNEEVNRG